MSPTFEASTAARRAYDRLPRRQQDAFDRALPGDPHIEWLAIGDHKIVE